MLRSSAIWLVLIVSMAVATFGMRRTSTTFDEIIMMAAGARGFHTGQFDLAPEHPPLLQYLYGLPIYLSRPNYPVESRPPARFLYRYEYSQHFFWRSGNDPERIAFLGRLVGIACAALLVLLTYRFSLRWGHWAAIVAATLVAFLPDLMAHAGVAYNDVPLALAFLLTLWAADYTARSPSAKSGALLGLCVALAFSVKFSAIALGPIVVLIVLAEALSPGGVQAAWLRGVRTALLTAVIVAYSALVLVYRGDFLLSEFRYGLAFTLGHVAQGHDAPGYLLGKSSQDGWWYFYPVVFLFKTPAALHMLAVLATVGFFVSHPSLPTAVTSRLRAPLIGVVVFALALMTSNLVIGFRYALPLLPPLCILIAIGASKLWRRSRAPVRLLLTVLPLLYVASTLSYYPFFLSYLSEYGPGRTRGDDVLLDSSLDWGQGLLELRQFMADREIDQVYLSYFGSALPEGYGIRYIPLPSHFPLPSQPAVANPSDSPEWLIISATNLHGLYLKGTDPFRHFRSIVPDTVLAHSLFAFRVADIRPALP